jgi:hypothetical protein
MISLWCTLSDPDARWPGGGCMQKLPELVGILEICNFKNLQSLRIEKTSLDCSGTSACFQQLSTLSALTQLQIINLSVSSHILCSVLARLPYLKSLKLAHTGGRILEVPGVLQCVADLKLLEVVDLEGLKVSWKVLDMLPAVKSITLSCPAANSSEPNHAAKCKVCDRQLLGIGAYRSNVSCATVINLPERVQVKTLILRHVQCAVQLPRALMDLTDLATLAVCVEKGRANHIALGNTLQDLKGGNRTVLVYEFDAFNNKWKAITFS